MSRYAITVTRQGRLDPDAVIGYDPPLRTYFLQAFPHQETDEPALWLGTYDHTLETHEDLHHAAIAHGYDFMPLPDVAAQLATDKAQEAGRPPHDGPLSAFLRRLQSEQSAKKEDSLGQRCRLGPLSC